MSARTRIALAAVVAALSLAVVAAPASAGVPDQQQPTVNTGFFAITPAQSLAQTFTPGQSGQLDQVDLYLTRLGGSTPLTVELRDVSGGAPGSTVLASATVPAADVLTFPTGAFVEVPFASPPAVDPSHQYAIVAYHTSPFQYGWAGAVGDVYAGGGSFFTQPVDWTPFLANAELAFKTYLAPWDFSGFFSPVDNPDTVNQTKAGSSIPVKFSLGGDRGLGVLADGYPEVELYTCEDVEDVDAIEQTTTANQGLTYDALTDTYSYVWKTDKNWKGKCGTLTLKLDDGSEHTALFQLK